MPDNATELPEMSLFEAFNEASALGFDRGYEAAALVLKKWAEEASPNSAQLFSKISEYLTVSKPAMLEQFKAGLTEHTMLAMLSEKSPQ